MRFGRSLNRIDWGTLKALKVDTFMGNSVPLSLSESSMNSEILGEFSALNETLNVIENAASYISEYKSPDFSPSWVFRGDSWSLALVHHLREVVVGLFDRIDDFSNKHTFGKHREIYEVIYMFNSAIRNVFDRRIESHEYLN